MLLRIFTFLSILIGAPVCFAQSPHLELTPTNVTDLSIRWSSEDDGSHGTNPVVRAYLHGPFNTVEGSTPSDPTNPDTLCTNIAKVWYNQNRTLTNADGTYCNPDDDGLCPVDPDQWFGDIPDDSTDPLMGMRAPHCQLNICGNTADPTVWPDQGPCTDSRGNMMGNGGHEIKVEGARPNGTYFLVFEKEDGTTEIFRKKYEIPPADCGNVTAAFHSGGTPSIDVTLNPTNANRIAVTGCGHNTGREVTGDGSQTFTCPFRGTQKTITFACQGSGEPDHRKVSASLGIPSVTVDRPGYDPATSQPLTVRYHVSRFASISVSRTMTLNYGFFSITMEVPTSLSFDSVPWVREVRDGIGGWLALTSENGWQGDPTAMFWPSWPVTERHLAGNQGNYTRAFTRTHSNCILSAGAIDFNGRETWNSVNLCDFPVQFNVDPVVGKYSYDYCYKWYRDDWYDVVPDAVASYCINYRMNIKTAVSCTNCVAINAQCDGWSNGSFDDTAFPSADRVDRQTSQFTVNDWHNPWHHHNNGEHPTGQCVFQALTYDGHWITPDNNPTGTWDLAIPYSLCDEDADTSERDGDVSCHYARFSDAYARVTAHH